MREQKDIERRIGHCPWSGSLTLIKPSSY